MFNNLKTGAVGEDIAAQYLRSHNYRILFRNQKWPWGELDLVARSPEGSLVIIEVKTLWGSEAQPELNYTLNKDRKTKRTAALFIAHYQNLIEESSGCRIDLVAVQIHNQVLRDWRTDCEIRHYENV